MKTICLLIAKILKPFDVSRRSKKCFVELVAMVFIIFLVGISLKFTINAFESANAKDLWVDEINGLVGRNASYWEIIRKGSHGAQVSNTPLDYLLHVFLTGLRLHYAQWRFHTIFIIE